MNFPPGTKSKLPQDPVINHSSTCFMFYGKELFAFYFCETSWTGGNPVQMSPKFPDGEMI